MSLPKLEDIRNTEPTASTKSGLSFSKLSLVDEESAPLVLDLVVKAVTSPSDPFGTMSMLVAPAPHQVPYLRKLETILDSKLTLLSQFKGYTRRATLTDRDCLSLKLKTVGDNWSFQCDAISPDHPSIPPGTSLKIRLNPGFYFSPIDKKYGLFYTLKILDII